MLRNMFGDDSNELWKYIDGYGNNYAVSNMGRVVSFRMSVNGRLMHKSSNGSGYMQVYLTDLNGNGKNVYVHRLVAQAFLGYDLSNKTLEVHHKNHNKSDCRVGNLELVTRSINLVEYHRYKHSKNNPENTTYTPIKDRTCVDCKSPVIYGSTRCSECERKRRIESHPTRPSAEQLYEMLKTRSFAQLGRDFGVSGNTIIKWCRVLGVPDNKVYYKNKYGKK